MQAAVSRAGYSDLTAGHRALLRNLGDRGARPTDLAVASGLTPQRITRVVNDLVARKVVRKDPDPGDGRGVIVRFTPAGLEGVGVASRHMKELEARFAEVVGADRWADVRAALETLFGGQPAGETPTPEDESRNENERLSRRTEPDRTGILGPPSQRGPV